jgi:hypothetical protein
MNYVRVPVYQIFLKILLDNCVVSTYLITLWLRDYTTVCYSVKVNGDFIIGASIIHNDVGLFAHIRSTYDTYVRPIAKKEKDITLI